MENVDFTLVTVVMILVPLILRIVPAIIIGVGGALALRKGYIMSGSAVAASAALTALMIVGQTAALHFIGPESYAVIFGWVASGVGLVSAGLLAGGILGLVSCLPRAGSNQPSR